MDQNRVENQVDEGTLQIHLTNASTGIPVKGAKISISYTGGPQQVLEEVDTDDSGNTEKITLDAPPPSTPWSRGKPAVCGIYDQGACHRLSGHYGFGDQYPVRGRCNAGSGDGGAGCTGQSD